MNNGYIELLMPEHPYARKNGTILEHRYVAEQMLGRYLQPDEVVHHIDKNRQNNDPSNLMVFKTIADHSAFHSGNDVCLDGDVWVAKDKLIRIKGKTVTYNICPCCKVELKASNAKICKKCFDQKQRLESKSKRPNKETLMSLLLEHSMVKIGEMYGVTDNAVRRWCKQYELPYRYNEIKKIKNTIVIENNNKTI